MFRSVAFAAITLLLDTPAHAQDPAARVDQLVSWVRPGMPGCAVAVSQHGEMLVHRAYGLANLETGAPIGPHTMFDIGSVQKQFSAAAALLLVEEGRLSLSADIRAYLPELPDYGHQITLDHLMTHTSGIRDWLALMNFNRGDENALTLILRQRGLNFAPGERWTYSNSNFELVKEIVARVSGMSFSEFARRRLFEPLGMEHTMYAADIRAATNGAVAYEEDDGVWKPAMLLGDERGGGAVLSTVGDLLLWNEALTSGRLGAFVTGKLQEPARLDNGRELTYARGLFVEDTNFGPAVWHTGSARAFGALLSRLPDQGLSIAMLCNAGEAVERNMAGRGIADLFLREEVVRVRGAEAAASSAGAGPGTVEVDLTGKAGLFFSEDNGDALRLGEQNGTLRVAGGPRLVAVAEDRFRNPRGALSFMSGDEFELRFLSPDKLELRSMEGAVTRYRRARPLSPTGAELQAFAGRYESEDLGAVFDISAGDNVVVVRLNGAQTIPFAPVDRDTFQRGPLTVRFLRDDTGQVTALDLSTPVLRNVRFARPD